MPRPPDAVWRDGVPATLAAAALDALEWLRVLQRLLEGPAYQGRHNAVARARLARCVAALEEATQGCQQRHETAQRDGDRESTPQ